MMDEQAVAALIKQAAHLKLKDHTEVKRVIEQALTGATDLNDESLQARCLCDVAWCEITEGHIKEGTQTALKALTLARQNNAPVVECRAMGMIGMAFYTAGNIYDALHVFERQRTLAADLLDYEQLAGVMSEIAFMYSRLGDMQRGLDTLKEALAISEALPNSLSHFYVLTNLVAAYRNTRQLDKALTYGHHLLSLSAPHEYHFVEALGQLNIATTHLVLGDLEAATRELAQLPAMLAKTPFPTAHIQYHIVLGVLANTQERHADSLAYFQTGVELCYTHNQHEFTIVLLRAVKEAQLRLGDAEAALATYQQIDEFIDKALMGQMETRLSIVRSVNEVENAWAQAKLERERAERLQHDITLQHEAEKQRLISQQLQLEAEYKAELLERKEAIILRLSHEIRNPLAVISASNELIERYYERMTSEQITKHTGQINQQVTRMTELLDDVLNALTVDQPPEL